MKERPRVEAVPQTAPVVSPPAATLRARRTSPGIRRARLRSPPAELFLNHVQLSGPRGPGRAPDQQIRWHTRAQASLKQRRRAPFCPSKCPSGPASFRAPPDRSPIDPPPIRAHLSKYPRKCQNTGHKRTPGTWRPLHPAANRDDPASRHRASRLILRPTWRTHSRVSACRSPPEQPHDVRICRDERVMGRIVILLAPRAGVLTTDRARNFPSSVTITRSPTGVGSAPGVQAEVDRAHDPSARACRTR
jgi:hypothetical protein